MSGKGSAPRPFFVPLDQFGDNYERTFGKKVVCPACGQSFRIKPDETHTHVCTPTEDKDEKLLR